MPAKQFKDFNKEAKDLLTKNFPVPGTWKIETKGKGGNREVILSTTSEFSEKTKNVNVDVEYNMKEYKLKTKTNINAEGKIKPKVTYELAPGHKVEATLQSLQADADFELTYEGEYQGAVFYDRVSKRDAEFQFAYPVGAITVGAGIAYGFAKGQTTWSVGARFADRNFTAVAMTTDLKKYSAGVYAPVVVNKWLVKLAAQADYTADKGVKGLVGFEAPIDAVAVFPRASTIRVRVANDLSSSISLILKLAANWTAALSINHTDITKVGVQLTLE
jgi:hypothetical protein